jgi:organic radical activating enzyme
METNYLQIGEAQIDEKSVMEMAAYIAHLEKEQEGLLEELKQAKAYLSATVHQRASAESKVRELQYRLDNKQVVDITPTHTIKTTLDTIELINPEQYREKANQR